MYYCSCSFWILIKAKGLVVLTLCLNYLCGLLALKQLSTHKGTFGLEAPASDPVRCNKAVIRLAKYNQRLGKFYKDLQSFYPLLWTLESSKHLGSQLQIGDSRLKDSSYPQPSEELEGNDDLIEHQLQWQPQLTITCVLTMTTTRALVPPGAI